MELGTSLIGLIFIAIFILPFALASLNRKKKNKLVLSAISDLAKERNCSISQNEICGKFAIAIDDKKNLFFSKLNEKDEVTPTYIDLSVINQCNVSNINRIVSNNKIIDKLALELTPIDKTKPIVILEFYNVEVSSQLTGELQSIEKWNVLINERLNN